MAKSLTLKEVKKMKADLEIELVGMLKSFEDDTGLKVTYFDVKRKRKKGETDSPVSVEAGPIGPIKDVNVNVDLDLFY